MAKSSRFPIIGVGASAGGIEALEGFFRGVPRRPGFAIVVVTHLDPQRESTLHEIITRFTAMSVQVVRHEAVVRPNCVYVMPANTLLGIEKGRLQVSKPAAVRQRKPIDIFLSALAIDQEEYAGGVILSGGDGDGTLGIKAIKERGGVTFAQIRNGYGPQHPGMPDSAISSGFVDFSLPAEDMGPAIVEYARGLSLLENSSGSDSAESEEAGLEAARVDIYTILLNQVGHDFAGYKPKTFLRRVQRRMQVVQLGEVETYVERLRQDPAEVGALFRDLLINVTTFFRDGEAFESLADLVVPRLFEERGAKDTIRLWVPGCATGEEVYSVAMMLREHMDRLEAPPRVQIFATDIDEHALSVARAGRYPAQLLDTVSPERRRRFFIPDGGTYVLTKDVRDLCIFSPHSVIRDPPFSRLDLISCRNLLIYFGLDVQNQVLPTFHYSLKPGGFLFLGLSENVTQFSELFSPVDKKHRIFRSREDDSSALRLPFTMYNLRAGAGSIEAKARASTGGSIALRNAVEAQVLERFAPAHVVVNRDGDVVYYSGRTGRYLEPAPGLPTRQLVTMARKGLRLELRAAFREAVETGRRVMREGLAVEGDDERVQPVTLTIDPIGERRGDEPLYLVLFADEGPALSREVALHRSATFDETVTNQLERELRETRERLQSLVEEYETALEELKSSNEELVSVNEELQSTNEELEASKEELQSVNEELHTVNAELSGKVEALDRANTDLLNLFESTDVATVFLDARLVIRSFTPAVSKVFNILPSDRGRPITDLASRLSLPQLAEDVARILQDGHSIERQIDLREEGGNFLVRLAPYRSIDQQIEGVVVTFVDVTSLTRSEMRQRVLVAELLHRTRNLLAVVQSVAKKTLDPSPPLGAYLDRLQALGRAQSLFSSAAKEGIELGELVRLELRAHGGDLNERITIAGPPVVLAFEQVQTLALALHELATNAVKHGALKETQGEEKAKGHLDVVWTVEAGERPRLKLDWQESAVTMPPAASERYGYGRQLIEEAVRYTLRANVLFTLGADGVNCRIDMPL